MSLPAWFEGFTIEQCLIDEVIDRIPRSLRGKVESRKVYRLDIEARTLDVLVDADELARRQAGWTPPAPRYTTGVLAKYRRLVGSAATGATCG
jgi:hypothetical protein